MKQNKINLTKITMMLVLVMGANIVHAGPGSGSGNGGNGFIQQQVQESSSEFVFDKLKKAFESSRGKLPSMIINPELRASAYFSFYTNSQNLNMGQSISKDGVIHSVPMLLLQERVGLTAGPLFNNEVVGKKIYVDSFYSGVEYEGDTILKTNDGAVLINKNGDRKMEFRQFDAYNIVFSVRCLETNEICSYGYYTDTKK
ncbi:MAG: hypothetical protein ACK4VO_03305 [Pseudobdellovibrio sp.]